MRILSNPLGDKGPTDYMDIEDLLDRLLMKLGSHMTATLWWGKNIRSRHLYTVPREDSSSALVMVTCCHQRVEASVAQSSPQVIA